MPNVNPMDSVMNARKSDSDGNGWSTWYGEGADTHVRPLRTKLVSHQQVKDPTVLRHFALVPQLCFPAAHSSTSAQVY